MRKITTTLFLGSALVASLLLSGCGEDTSTSSIITPKDTTKLIREVANNHTDWTWFVGTDGTQNATSASFSTFFNQGIPSEVEHFQYFLDTDNNANTGFSFGQDSWRISGADILIEDGNIYKSESTTEWKWTFVGELDTYTRSKINGIEQINFAANKNILGITADTVNVTIEPFNANWESSYSTISTQAVTMVDNDSPLSNQEKIEKQLENSDSYLKYITKEEKTKYLKEQGGLILFYQETRDGNYAVVLSASAGSALIKLDYYDIQADRPQYIDTIDSHAQGDIDKIYVNKDNLVIFASNGDNLVVYLKRFDLNTGEMVSSVKEGNNNGLHEKEVVVSATTHKEFNKRGEENTVDYKTDYFYTKGNISGYQIDNKEKVTVNKEYGIRQAYENPFTDIRTGKLRNNLEILQRDANGHILKATNGENSGYDLYEYNKKGQLIQRKLRMESRNFEYDEKGRIVKETYSFYRAGLGAYIVTTYQWGVIKF